MLVPLVLLITPEHGAYAFLTYFSVGIWQTVSCYITALKYPGEESASRYRYRMILSWGLGIAIPGFLLAGFSNGPENPDWLDALSQLGQGIAAIMLVLALFVSPVLAIWYFTICGDDLKNLRDRNDSTAPSYQITNNES